MYSVLPAFVSVLFLGYGLYVVAVKGLNRVTAAFLLICLTTFAWQGSWAVLFQVHDPQVARFLVKFGYLLIIFLPTSLYHFMVELTRRSGELRYVWLSYLFAAGLAVVNVGSDWFVEGYYAYYWGYYPQAGLLHPLHVLQTLVLVARSLYIAYRQQKTAAGNERMRLRLCFAGTTIYSFAAVDYLCNYGVEFYPPGVVFIAVGLGLFSVAVARYDLMSSMSAVVRAIASMAHELRTPLAGIGMLADTLVQRLPDLHRGYRLAVEHGLYGPTEPPSLSRQLLDIPRLIRRQVDHACAYVESMVATARTERIDTSDFRPQAMHACVEDALASFPFAPGERERVAVTVASDFEFHGSSTLFVFVLFNLLKNALYALKAADRGDIVIAIAAGSYRNRLTFTDTSTGMPAAVRARVFEDFFTTKTGTGVGIGLPFCRRVLSAFGGTIRCESEEGRYTRFVLEFPPLAARVDAATPNGNTFSRRHPES